MTSNDDPGQTTDAPDPYAEQVKTWIAYTRYLGGVDGLLLGVRGSTELALQPAAFAKVNGVLTAAHVAVQGVDQELVVGITDMQAGKAPAYEFPPAPIPDWPTESATADIFLGTWKGIKAALETMMSKATSGSALGAAIAGLVNSGDACVQVLEDAFSGNGPASAPQPPPAHGKETPAKPAAGDPASHKPAPPPSPAP